MKTIPEAMEEIHGVGITSGWPIDHYSRSAPSQLIAYSAFSNKSDGRWSGWFRQ